MRIVALVVVVVLWATAAPAARSRVLVQSGTVAPDGRALNFFVAPAASGPGRVAFLGSTSAILTRDAVGTFAVVLRTGDPLPAPLRGTFNTFADPVVNDAGAIAFRATVNSLDAESGLFLHDGTTVVPVVLTGGAAGGAVQVDNPPDLNGRSEVLYEDGRIAIWLWSAGARRLLVARGGASPSGGRFRSFGDRPVLNDAGRVAFQADTSSGRSGLFTVAEGPVTAIAVERQPSPVPDESYRDFGRRHALSIDPRGRVAFAASIGGRDGVLVHDPVGPTTTLLATLAELPGDLGLTGIEERYVGIDGTGTVAFVAAGGVRRLFRTDGVTTSEIGPVADDAGGFPPRLTDAGAVVWSEASSVRAPGGVTVAGPADTTPIGVGATAREPSINRAGLVAMRATHAVLYLRAGDRLQHVAAAGEPIAGAGTLTSVGAPAVGPGL
ncbi:MAG TPA: choice-of-anchor tandem repeat NxxGxxAF-containing protein, partial [Candidatus Binatia bacterium]|nr:choice-of-anchor tandem repeat NxxGxxAF-containing protein [Candidatus Binatia bacterium]